MPTVAEQGYPGFEMTQWYGLLAPASLPQPAAEKLALAAAAAVRLPASTEKLSADAAIAIGGTPEEFRTFIAIKQQRWRAVIAGEDQARLSRQSPGSRLSVHGRVRMQKARRRLLYNHSRPFYPWSRKAAVAA